MLKSRLTVKHLKMIHAIESAESLTRAAELLNISQPALSSRLQDAENLLETQLFVRRGRKLTISPSGQLLLRSARRILDELQRVENEILNVPNPFESAVRVGMPQYASFSWLPNAVKRFESLYPNTSIEIVSEAALNPRTALVRNDVDVAIVSSPNRRLQIDRSRFRCKRLLEDEFVALLPAGHANAKKPFLVADDFANETYITNSATPERNREYELFFQPNSVYPKRVVEVGFVGAILELVAAGIGTTIITRWIMEKIDLQSDLVPIPLSEKGLHVFWYGIYPLREDIQHKANTLCEAIMDSSTA